MESLIQKLKTSGGKIVSSNTLTPFEIAYAQSNNNFYVDEDGYGFAYIANSVFSNRIETN